MKPKDISEDSLELLGTNQRKIVLEQWERHWHPDKEVDFDVSGEGEVLKGFKINEGIWDPFLASGRYHARYLFYNSALFHGKTAIEIGCGSGLLGVVLAKYGAERVIMTDISRKAVINAKENAKRFGVEHKVRVAHGDLYNPIDKATEMADLVVWAIPFFRKSEGVKGDSISDSMLMDKQTLARFIGDSRNILKDEGVLVMPSYSLGGMTSFIESCASHFGYDMETRWKFDSDNGIQKGTHYMHELRRERK